MASSRKRPRPDEDSQAECPFSVTHPDPNERGNKIKRRRQGSDENAPPKIGLQASPFSPMGKFKDPNNTMDRYYQVQPYQKWIEMTRYNSFVLNGVKYYSEGFIFVANSSTIERQKNPNEPRTSRLKSDDDWVARILEIRASDEHHVYARVYWMYWPDELPVGTQEGKRSISGRQPYHGQNELIASNHMDVINVVSVTAQATVNQWDETNEEDQQQALYWRQAFDVRSMELSSAQPICKCGRPENPDKKLINCANEDCKKWLHDDCLINAVLEKTFKRLGTDKPHKTTRVKTEDAQRPLSPSESGAAQTTQQSIDVKPEDQETIKLADVESSNSTVKAETRIVPIVSGQESKRKGGKSRKSEGKGSETPKWQGHFTATINEETPSVIDIVDLRQNVTGGEKTWTEPAHCLFCGSEIH
ncbi:hypothetical protein GGR57DRAFT_247491 [Xylariaceae sp. FL1272]|nr:hypothetical protein GGR57DRAFT_247491 [Xylariaceae sp. FL1272]